MVTHSIGIVQSTGYSVLLIQVEQSNRNLTVTHRQEKRREEKKREEKKREKNKKNIGGHLGMILGRFGGSWKVFWGSWGVLGSILAGLGGLLGRLGRS